MMKTMKMSKLISIISLMIILLSSIAYAGYFEELFLGKTRTSETERPQVVVGDKNLYGYLNYNNNWTGVNTFYNFTWVNYQTINITGTLNVSKICIGLICIDSWSDVNSSDSFVPYTGATQSVDLGINNLTANYVWADTVNVSYIASKFDDGYIDVRGNPWYMTGSSLEIVENLSVDSYILSNLTPSPTNTLNLGSGANRWKNLYVQNISAEVIDTYNITSDSLLVEGNTNITKDVYIGGNIHIDGNMSVKRPYLMWSDNTTQTMTLPNTPYIINFSTVEDSYAINTEGGKNITVVQSGDYKIDVSAIFSTNAPNKKIEFWVQKTNTSDVFVNVDRSNTIMTLPTASSEIPLAVPFIIDLEPGEKIRFMMATNDAGSQLLFVTNTSYSPATPSIIITMFKISEVTD